MEDIKKQKKLEIKTIINKIFNSILFPIIIGILLFLKTFIFYQNTITVNETINKETIIGSVYFLLTTIVIVSSLPNKGRIIGSIVLDVLISTLLFFNNLYYTYSSSVLSIAQITNLQYGEEISNTLPMLFQISELIYWIDIVVIIILLVKKYISIETDKNLTLKKNVAKIIVCIILALGCIKVDNKYIEKAKEYPFNKDMQVKKSTIYGYHIADIENTLNIKKQAKYTNKCDLQKEYKELRDKYNEKYSESNYELQGTAKGKNVIILQLESIQNFVINTKINGKEITPNLNKFLNENIEFTNMYMQSYSSTADSEFSTVTSLYPMENGMSYSKYYTNSYEDIFKMFKNGGYTTSYMHGNYGYFWNRENVYKNLKVDNIELKNNFEDVSENIMGYLSDELLYRQAVKKLENYEKPFISYIVAASSHTSFSLEGLQDRSKVNIDTGKYQGTFFGSYLEAVNYADYAFGCFLQELKDANLYDDSVILVFGDHNGIDMYNDELIDFLKSTKKDITDVDVKTNYINVACGMKIPEIKNLKIEKPVNKLDIKPTFAYLIDEEEGVALGTNMFARKDFISLNNERIVTSRYYYDEKWFKRKDGTEVDFDLISDDEKKLLEEYYDDMKKELDISVSISINNLLKD